MGRKHTHILLKREKYAFIEEKKTLVTKLNSKKKKIRTPLKIKLIKIVLRTEKIECTNILISEILNVLNNY